MDMLQKRRPGKVMHPRVEWFPRAAATLRTLAKLVYLTLDLASGCLKPRGWPPLDLSSLWRRASLVRPRVSNTQTKKCYGPALFARYPLENFENPNFASRRRRGYVTTDLPAWNNNILLHRSTFLRHRLLFQDK